MSVSEEVWKTFSYKGRDYSVSDKGNLRSEPCEIDTSYITKNGKFARRITKVKGKELTKDINRSGYVVCRVRGGVH